MINHQLAKRQLYLVNALPYKTYIFSILKKKALLTNFSLTISKGDKIALVGKSGSGKTTLMMMMMQYLQPTSGHIMVDDKKLEDKHRLSWRKNISYVPQNPIILDSSLMENIAFGMKPEAADKIKILQLIKSIDLESWLQQLPEGLDTIVGEQGIKISGGQRQRIGLARALYQDTHILLLDEITSHLDAVTREEILHVLEKLTFQKKTIVMVTHDESFLHLFTKVFRLE